MICSAQYQVIENDIRLQKRKIKFGIHLGYTIQDFKIVRSQSFVESDSILAINTPASTGFGIYILSSVRLHKNLEFRFIPGVTLGQRQLDFTIENGTTEEQILETTTVEFPFNLKFKSDPIKDFRFHVFAGIKYSLDLASKSQKRNEEDVIKLERNDLSIDYGVGFEVNFPYFILAPEFKVSNGLFNVHAPTEGLQISNAIEKLFNRTFTISLVFEG